MQSLIVFADNVYNIADKKREEAGKMMLRNAANYLNTILKSEGSRTHDEQSAYNTTVVAMCSENIVGDELVTAVGRVLNIHPRNISRGIANRRCMRKYVLHLDET